MKSSWPMALFLRFVPCFRVNSFLFYLPLVYAHQHQECHRFQLRFPKRIKTNYTYHLNVLLFNDVFIARLVFKVPDANMELSVLSYLRIIQNLIGLLCEVRQELLCLFQNITFNQLTEIRLLTWFSK